jgi:hypothetical protein
MMKKQKYRNLKDESDIVVLDVGYSLSLGFGCFRLGGSIFMSCLLVGPGTFVGVDVHGVDQCPLS